MTDKVVLNTRRQSRIHGNILSPGTPNRNRRGNILTPGTQSRRRGVGRSVGGGVSAGFHTNGQVIELGRGSGRGRRGLARVPVVYVPYGYYYTGSGYDAEFSREPGESDEQADFDTTTRSVTDYVIRVNPDSEGQREARALIYEIRPEQGSRPTGYEPGLEPGPAPDSRSETETEESPLFLIALRNGQVYAASEHWLAGDTFHYITAQGAHNLVTLDEVDMGVTARLNRERGLSFVVEVREDALEEVH